MLEVDTKVMSYLFANVELIRYYLKLSSKRQKRFFLKSRIREYASQVNIKERVDVEFYMKLFDKFLTNYLCKTAKFYKQIVDFVNCRDKMGKLSSYALRMLRINLKLSKPVMEQVLVLNRPIISSFAANVELLSDTVALDTWVGGSRNSVRSIDSRGSGESRLSRRSGFRFTKSSSPGRGLCVSRLTGNEIIKEEDDEGEANGSVCKSFKRSSMRSSVGPVEPNSLVQSKDPSNRRNTKKDSIFATLGPNGGPRNSDFSLGSSLYHTGNQMHLIHKNSHKDMRSKRKGKFSVKLENKIVNRLLNKIGHSNDRRFKSIDCGRALKKRSMIRKSVLFLNPSIAQRNSKLLRNNGDERLANLRYLMTNNAPDNVMQNSQLSAENNFPKCVLTNQLLKSSLLSPKKSNISGKNVMFQKSKTNFKNVMKSGKKNLFASHVENIIKKKTQEKGLNLHDLGQISEQSEISSQQNAIRERCRHKGSRKKRQNEKDLEKVKRKYSIPRFIDWGYELRKGLKMKKKFKRMARKASRPRIKKEPIHQKMKNKIHFYMLKKNNLMEDNFVISAKEENFLLKHIVLFSIVKYNLFQRLQKISFKYSKKDVNMKDSNGNTPLYYSCQSGNLKISQFLIDHGAELNIKCQNGDTPVHMAFKSGSPQLIYKLFHYGADMNAVNNDSITPLGYGTFKLLKELNLLDGFATFNENRAKNLIGKEHLKQCSISKLQNSSSKLTAQVKKFLSSKISKPGPNGNKKRKRTSKAGPNQGRRRSRQIKAKPRDNRNYSTKKQNDINIYSPKSRHSGFKLNHSNEPTTFKKLSLKRKSQRSKQRNKRRTMMIEPMNKEFLSNNLNYRIKRGKTQEFPKKSKLKLKKKNTLDDKRRKKRSQKTLRQFKMSMEEFRLAQSFAKKKGSSKENNPFEFDNDFREDTCGCDVFLLKKLPQMYDPKLPNEILFKVDKIRKVNEHRGKFFKQRKLTTQTKENQELVNTALKCSKLTDNNKLAFNKNYEHKPREMIRSEIPHSDFTDF